MNKIEKRDEMLIDQLLIVWKNSVKETHLFLSKDEIENIEPYVFQALNNIKHLIIKILQTQQGYNARPGVFVLRQHKDQT